MGAGNLLLRIRRGREHRGGAAAVAMLRPEATKVRKEATALQASGPGASAGFLTD